MDFYKKYLKYKTKYLNYKNNMEILTGAGSRDIIYNLELPVLPITGAGNPRYFGFINIRKNIKDYLDNKNNVEIRKIIKEISSIIGCKTDCWINFIKNVQLPEYLATFNTTVFYLYPFTTDNDKKYSMDNYYKPKNNLIKYDFAKKFLSVTFTDIVMFDYDIKDEIISENITPEQHKQYLLGIISKIQTLVNIFYNKYNIILKFLLVNSDRGYHFFLINKTAFHRNLYLMELMLTICNDAWYTAFAYSNGWSIRLNKKKPDDFIAELSYNKIFQDCLQNRENIPENKFDTTKLTKNFSFESKVYKKDIDIRYPSISDNSLIIISPSINPEQHNSSVISRCNISPDDQSTYIFNKICYHYYLIRYFQNFDNDKILKLECNIGNIILESEDTSFINDLRDDLKNIARHFKLENVESIQDPLSFNLL
jgi:hypothetical protein